GYAPERVAAVVAADAGQGDPLGLDTVELGTRAMGVPQLILAGASDVVSGTERPYRYFRKYFDRGAPWTFVVQNLTPHCCIINAKALVLMWLDAMVVQPGASRPLFGFVSTKPSDLDDCPNPRSMNAAPLCHGTRDSWGETNWRITTAVIRRR